MKLSSRNLVYFFVLAMVSLPLILKYTLAPVKMSAAQKVYNIIDRLELSENEIVLLAMDFGPSTKAENAPQAQVLIEHLMRRRLPFAVFTQYAEGEVFLSKFPEEIGERLTKETGEIWEYGTDWVNLGFKTGGVQFLQGFAKSNNILEYLAKDAYGTSLHYLPLFKDIRTIESVKLLGEMTGLVGMFNNYIQFFQRKGHKPLFVHGPTSITIPEAYIFLDSGQLDGLFEGFAGAAWYSELLSRNFEKRVPDEIQLSNTALGIGHLTIIFLIILGNVLPFFRRPSNA